MPSLHRQKRSLYRFLLADHVPNPAVRRSSYDPMNQWPTARRSGAFGSVRVTPGSTPDMVLLTSEVAKALAEVGCILISLRVLLNRNTGARTDQYAMNFTTEDGSIPASALFYLLTPAAGFTTADGVSFHINLSRELLNN
jgi:hypothetical protein